MKEGGPITADNRRNPVEDRYRGLFDNSPVSLWEEDFSGLKLHLERLRQSGVDDLRAYFKSHPSEVHRCASFVTVVDVNQATLSLLECDDKAQLLGRLPVFFRQSSYDLFVEEILALAEGKTIFEIDAINETLKGQRIAVRLRLAIAPGHEGTWSKVFASVTDMSAWKEAEAELKRLAQFDTLTNLPNRATFNERLNEEAGRARRRRAPIALLMLDLDNFKDVNDAFGHPVGDAFLIAVAERLRENFRAIDTMARLGGDEFAILQCDADQPDSSGALATRLLALFDEPFTIEDYSIPASASIGIAYSPTGEIDAEQIIRQADLALYTAKEDGRGTFRFHDKKMDRDVHDRMILGQDLRRAISSDQLFLSFQPQIDLGTMRVSGLEALLRWRHADRGLLPPNEFLEVAESSGLIIEIGEWVMREAARALRHLRKRTHSDLYMSVNVSPVQMRMPGFSSRLLAVLREEELPPSSLELELTEHVLMHETPQLKLSLEELHQAGVRFSVDDFGAAYSSMLYLRQYSVDKLKIAHSLLENIERSGTDAGIVSTLIALGDKLGLRVLAKGVERGSQLDFLMQNGCTEAQGYYFSEPVALDEIVRLIQNEAAAKRESEN